MKPLKMFFLLSIGNMILTTVHHLYGAIIYETPFRMHVVFIAIPVIAVLLITYKIYRKQSAVWYGRIAFWIFSIVAIAVPIGTIGIYEGGYNHLLKNLLFFGGSPQDMLDRLFPPPTYEMPNDFWFEATGILQLFPAVFGIYYLFKLKK